MYVYMYARNVKYLSEKKNLLEYKEKIKWY